MFSIFEAGKYNPFFCACEEETVIFKKIGLLFVSLIVLIVFLSGTVTAQEAGQKEGWQFYADLYLWIADFKGEAVSGSDIDIEFHDIIDALDFGLMAGLGAKKDKWTSWRTRSIWT